MESVTESKKLGATTLHVRIDAELREKFEEMRKADRREGTDFVRILIEDEWTRRQVKTK